MKKSVNKKPVSAISIRSMHHVSTDISVNALSDYLKLCNIKMDGNIYQRLRSDGCLRRLGKKQNLPSRAAIRNGWMRVEEKKFTTCDGVVTKYKFATVTPIGLKHFRNVYGGYKKKEVA